MREPMIPVCIKFSAEEVHHLDRLAEQCAMTRSELVRQAVRAAEVQLEWAQVPHIVAMESTSNRKAGDDPDREAAGRF